VFHRSAQPLRHEARGFVAALGACCALGCGGVAASPDAAPSPEAAPEAAEPRPPLSRPPAKASRAGGCAADGVVWSSVELRTPAQVDALAGCERVAGDLSLLGLVSTPTTALSSLKAVDGVLSVLGIATEVALDGFVSLEQVGGLVLQRLDHPHLSALGRLRTIGPTDPTDPRRGKLEISLCSELFSLAGLDSLESLDSLVLRDNATLTRLSGMTRLRELRSLDAENNALLNLDGIAPVRELRLVSSQVTRLRELGEVPQLRRLVLGENAALSTLLGGRLPAEMDEIVLRHNDRLEDLAGLEQLASVGVLSITDNPLLEQVGLPQLQRADRLCVWGNGSLSEVALAPLRAVAGAQPVAGESASCQ